MRNTGELAWRRVDDHHPGHGRRRRARTHPTDDWTVDDLDERIAEVRQQFVDTLDALAEGEPAMSRRKPDR